MGKEHGKRGVSVGGVSGAHEIQGRIGFSLCAPGMPRVSGDSLLVFGSHKTSLYKGANGNRGARWQRRFWFSGEKK